MDSRTTPGRRRRGVGGAVVDELQFLSFRVTDGTGVLVDIARVVEVLSLSAADLVPMPDTHACIVGVTNWRGEILWVVDLSQFLGYPPLAAASAMRCTVVVVGNGAHRLGWLVPQVEETVRHPRAQILPVPTMIFPLQLHAYLQGYLLQPGENAVLVLDAAAVLDSPYWQAT